MMQQRTEPGQNSGHTEKDKKYHEDGASGGENKDETFDIRESKDEAKSHEESAEDSNKKNLNIKHTGTHHLHKDDHGKKTHTHHHSDSKKHIHKDHFPSTSKDKHNLHKAHHEKQSDVEGNSALNPTLGLLAPNVNVGELVANIGDLEDRKVKEHIKRLDHFPSTSKDKHNLHHEKQSDVEGNFALNPTLGLLAPDVSFVALVAKTAVADDLESDRKVKEHIKRLVDLKVAEKKVVIFVKTWCPYCQRVTKLFNEAYVGEDKAVIPEDYEVVELDNDPEVNDYKLYFKVLTGAQTVPRVFINGKCIGGAKETEAFHAEERLLKILAGEEPTENQPQETK